MEFSQNASTSQAAESLSGSTVGRFVVYERLGKGGMGEVYRAEDTKLKRSVALKRIAPHLRSDPDYRQRFIREAERTSRFSEPHVAAIYDVLEQNSEIYLVMEYVEGQTLRKVLQQTVSFDQFFDIALQCCQALVSAHEHGILHCDIKPENIMLTSTGKVKILDFGLAKRLPRSDQSSTLKRTQILGGTPAYMAPEVLLENLPDEHADLFSLGVIFYEALTGYQPFLANSFAGTAEKVLHEDPPPLHLFNPAISEELESLVRRMLAKKPSERFSSARELEAALKRLHTMPTAGTTPEIVTAVGRHVPKIISSVALMFILAAGALVMWPWAARWFRPVPRFSAQNWILISDFERVGGSTIPDASLREGLSIALQQSYYLNVYPRTRVYQVLQRMKRGDVEHIDEALGREICQRENLAVLLTGSIVQAGNESRIVVRAIEPNRGDLLFAEKTELREQENIFEKVDQLAGRIRGDLGDSRSAINNARPLAKVTTGSLEALELYSQAVDARAQGDTDRALLLLQSALTLDPNFAMAHFLIADAYQIVGDRAQELDHLSRAYSLRDAVTERERLLIESSYYDLSGHEDEALDALRALVGLYPNDAEARERLASEYYDVGDLAQSIQELQQVIKLDPNSSPAYARLILSLARSNAPDEALQVYHAAQLHAVASPGARWAVGLALWNQGKIDDAQAQFQHLQEIAPSYESIGRIYGVRVLIYEGRLAAAEQELQVSIRQDEAAKRQAPELLGRYLLAQIAAVRGRKDKVRRQLESILRSGEPEAFEAADLRRAGALYAQIGDVDSARRVLQRLQGLQAELPNSFNKSCRDNVAGEIALAERRYSEAAQLFLASLSEYPLAPSHQGLARTYEQQQSWANAATEWQKLLQARGEVLQDHCPTDLVLGYLSLARVYRHLNNVRATRAAYKQFFEIWQNGDHLAFVEKAQRDYKELVRMQAGP